jgi:hypothetical protein
MALEQYKTNADITQVNITLNIERPKQNKKAVDSEE